MSYPINYPTPQGANIQIFQEGGTASDWVKPQGASFVWFTLIGAGGAGGSGDGTSGAMGGGSGAVTNFMGPAFLMPDVLRINVGRGAASTNGTASTVVYQQKDGTGYTLLTADFGRAGLTGASGGAGGTASTSNFFSCMGFFQSVAGQAATLTGPIASATTFLSAGSIQDLVPTPNYGYPVGSSSIANHGYFQMQPIIVGRGGAGGFGEPNKGLSGGLGCGGGGGGIAAGSNTTGRGGDGLVVIITW
jgi:hypothetical protein